MDAVVGVFPSREAGERAIQGLVELGFTKDRITMLTPHSSEAEIHSVPTTEAEPPGIGRAIGAVAGGAAGAATGIQAAFLAGLVPGVGPVLVLGAIGALLLGIGGSAVGATLDATCARDCPRTSCTFTRTRFVEAGPWSSRFAEAAAYRAAGGDFTRDELTYRRGFEAACRLARDGATYADVIIASAPATPTPTRTKHSAKASHVAAPTSAPARNRAA